MVIPHVLHQVSNADEAIQFIAKETGSSVTTLLTSCLPLCMMLVLTSNAIQQHSGCDTRKDERSVALHNMLMTHISEEVAIYMFIIIITNMYYNMHTGFVLKYLLMYIIHTYSHNAD